MNAAKLLKRFLCVPVVVSAGRKGQRSSSSLFILVYRSAAALTCAPPLTFAPLDRRTVTHLATFRVSKKATCLLLLLLLPKKPAPLRDLSGAFLLIDVEAEEKGRIKILPLVQESLRYLLAHFRSLSRKCLQAN